VLRSERRKNAEECLTLLDYVVLGSEVLGKQFRVYASRNNQADERKTGTLLSSELVARADSH
jgi:hypothetical protein